MTNIVRIFDLRLLLPITLLAILLWSLGSGIAQARTDIETTTTISSDTPSVYGGLPVTLTVDVTSGGGVPTGSVSIAQSCAHTCGGAGFQTIATVPLVNGQATFQTSPLSTYGGGQSSYTFRAIYLGTSGFAPSESPTINQPVLRNVPTVVVTSSANPAVLGSSVTLTATVTTDTGPAGPIENLSLQFYDGNAYLGARNATNNVATFTTDAFGFGTHNITARTNSGITPEHSSGTSAVFEQVIDGGPGAATSVTVSSDTPSVYGGLPVTLTVDVTSGGGVPTGSVSIAQSCAHTCGGAGFQTIATVPLVNGQATFQTSPLSTYGGGQSSYTFRATYLGGAGFAANESPTINQPVLRNVPTVVVTSSANPAVLGSSVTLTATVTTDTGPAGPIENLSLQFYDGNAYLGARNATNNVATFTTDAFGFGTHNITARTNSGITPEHSSGTSAVFEQVIDNGISPAVIVSGPTNTVTGPFTVDVVFSTPVTGFELADFTVGNGTASDLSGSGTTYAATITPTVDGPVTVDIVDGVANDGAGNPNLEATQYAVEADITAPSLVISGPAGPVAGPFTATFTFSEPVTGFDIGDIRVGEFLTHAFNVADDATLLLDGAKITTTANVGGTTYIFAASGNDSGVSVFSAGPDGTLTNVFNVADDATVELLGLSSISTAVIGGTTYLFVSSSGDDGVSVFSVANNGALTNVFNITDDASLALKAVTSATPVTIGGSTFLYTTSLFDEGISIFSVAANGTLSHLGNVTDDATMALRGAISSTTTVVAGTPYLFVSGQTDDGISVFSIANNGTLTNVFNVYDDATLRIDNPRYISTAAVGGSTYLFVPGLSDNGLSVFRVANNGVLTNVANVVDDATLELAGASFASTAVIGGATILFVASIFDDGVSVFSVSNNGALTSVANLTDDPTLLLDNAASVNTATIGGTTYLYVTGLIDDGISVFRVGNSLVTDLAGSGSTYTATITPVSDGLITINVASGAANDSAGHDNLAAVPFSITNDQTSPSLTISGPTGPVVDAFTVTFTFSENVSGYGIGDITVGNGTASNFMGSGTTYTTTITPTVDGSVTVNVAGGVASDAAGNGNTAATQFAVDYDGSAPSLVITGPAGPVNVPFTATFTFSEAVTGFEDADIIVGNGTAGDLFGDGTVFTATITPTADGPVTVDVAANVVTDGAGNGNTAAAQYSVAYDITGPSLLISGPTGPVAGDFTATFTFSELVTGFDVTDVGVGNGAASQITGSGAVYTATIFPVTDGPVTIDVVAGVAIDAVGNANTAAAQFSLSADLTAPRIAAITRQNPTASPTNADSVTWRVTFDEAVTFTQGQVSSPFALTNVDNVSDDATLRLAAANSVTTSIVNGTTYLFAASTVDDGVSVFSVANDGNLTNAFNVTDGGILELDGAASVTTAVVSGTTYLFVAGFTDDGVSVFSIADSGVLTNVANTADDTTLRIRGPRSVATAVVDGTTYLFVAGAVDSGVSVFSVATDGSLTNVYNIADNGVLELAGAYSVTTTVLNGATYLFVAAQIDDGISVFSVASDGSLTNVENVSDDVTLNLDSVQSVTTATVIGTTYLIAAGSVEDGVSVFSVADDGSLTNVFNVNDDATLELDAVSSLLTAMMNGTTYLFVTGYEDHGVSVFSIANDGTLNNEFNVTDSGALELQGAHSVTTSLVNGTPYLFVAGNLDSGISVFSVNPAQSASQNFSLIGTTASLTEAVVSATQVDITATGGDLAGLNGTVTLGLAPGQTFADLAGNALSNTTPTGANDNSFDIDNAAPSLAITGPVSPVTGAFTATFTFSESVTGFELADININNGAASNFAGSGSTYTATITPTVDGSLTVDVALGVAADAAGNTNTAATQYSVTLDATAPAVAITGPTDPVTGAFTATFTFTEVVTGFELADITVGNGTASNFAGSGTTYTASITPTADGAVTIDVAQGVAADAAGNGNTAATQFTLSADVTAPRIASITRQDPTTSPTNADSVTWRVTFDEAVAFTQGQVATPFALTNAFNVTDDATLELYRVASVATAEINGVTYLFAAGYWDGGVSVFSVANDGGLTNVFNLTDAGPLELNGVFTVTTSVVNGTTYLYAAGFGDDGVSVFSVANNGTLTNAFNVTDGGALELEGATSVTTAVLNGTTYLFAAGYKDNGVSVFSVANDGSLTNVFNVTDDATLEINGVRSVTTTVVNGVTYLFAAGYTDDGVSVFSVANDGTLTNVTNVTDDATLEVDGVVSVATAVVEGVTYLFTAGYTDDGVSVFSVANDGTLTNVFNLSDSNSLELDGAWSVSTSVVNGTTYLFVAGRSDNGVSVFSVANDGSLTNVGNVADDAALELGGVISATTAVVNSVSYLFTAGIDDDGISVFSITPPQSASQNFSLAGSTASLAETVISPTIVDVTATGGDLAGFNGTVTLALASGQTFADLAGNPLVNTAPTGANDNTYDIDNSAPALVISGPASPVTGAFTATFTFSEAVSGFALADISVSNGAASGLSGSGATYTATITPEHNGEVTVDVAGGAATDAAGNGNSAAAQFAVDNNEFPPRLLSILRESPDDAVTRADTLTWRVEFDESMTGIDAADFAVTASTASISNVTQLMLSLPQLSQGDGSIVPFAISRASYLVTASGGNLASFNGDVGLSIADGATITDDGGAALVSDQPEQANELFLLDNIAPTAELGLSDDLPVTGPVTVTIQFSEPVTGMTIDDIRVTGAIATNLITNSASNYEFTVTPAYGAVDFEVHLYASAAQDVAGNPNIAAEILVPVDLSRRLTIRFPGLGSGRVRSPNSTDVDCSSECSLSFQSGLPISLTVEPANGSNFASWTEGPCAGSSSHSCSFTLDTNLVISARFTLDNPPAGYIFASVLPAARSGYLNGPDITAFLNVIGSAASQAQTCSIEAPAGSPVSLSYQAVDGTNAPIGPLNPVFDIPAGSVANFVIALTPTAQTPSSGYIFLPVINCQNASLDPIVGVNSLLLTIGAAQSPDLVSIGATPSGDGVIRINEPGSTQLFASAVVNIGTGDGTRGAGEVALTVTPQAGPGALPLSLEICQVNASAQCITPRGPSTGALMQGDTPLFFMTFVRTSGDGTGIALDPANARVFLRFTDGTGTLRSLTSAAVTATANTDIPETSGMLPVGRWSVLRRTDAGRWPSLVRMTTHVLASGTVIFDDGETIETAVASASSHANRFDINGLAGRWRADRLIQLGRAFAQNEGEFWGIRDDRSDRPAGWADAAGRYGSTPDGISITTSGAISGTMNGCLVSGQGRNANPIAPGQLEATVILMSCPDAGSYSAVIDLPDNDNGPVHLIIAGDDTGWRLQRR